MQRRSFFARCFGAVAACFGLGAAKPSPLSAGQFNRLFNAMRSAEKRSINWETVMDPRCRHVLTAAERAMLSGAITRYYAKGIRNSALMQLEGCKQRCIPFISACLMLLACSGCSDSANASRTSSDRVAVKSIPEDEINVWHDLNEYVVVVRCDHCTHYGWVRFEKRTAVGDRPCVECGVGYPYVTGRYRHDRLFEGVGDKPMVKSGFYALARECMNCWHCEWRTFPHGDAEAVENAECDNCGVKMLVPYVEPPGGAMFSRLRG